MHAFIPLNITLKETSFVWSNNLCGDEMRGIFYLYLYKFWLYFDTHST